MSVTFSDSQILDLIQERKPLPESWRSRLRLWPKRGHEEGSIDLIGEGGNQFKLILTTEPD